MAFEFTSGSPLARCRASGEITRFSPIDLLEFQENKGICVYVCVDVGKV